MSGELFEQVKMAQKLYNLAVKYEDRVSKGVVIFAKQVCNEYTKSAKEMKLVLTSEELIKNILK